MSTAIKFGTSGWRAIVADEFTVANIRLAVAGVAAYVKSQPEPHRVLVGRDPRFLGESFVAEAAGVLATAGVEPIVKPVWDTVQAFLRSWVGAPAAIPAGEPGPLAHLLNGLVMSGLAMQEMLTSRPASGAEHQFSHLWDMQRHVHEGRIPLHGFKVGIGTLEVRV